MSRERVIDIAKPELENTIVCWGSFDLGGKCVGTHETRRLAAQMQGGNEVLPLYLKQEPREPLSDEAICEILLKKEWKGFVELIRQVEKLHGIGE